MRVTQRAISGWERTFRAEARADGFRGLIGHLAVIGIAEPPDVTVEATIHAVRTCIAYRSMDGGAGCSEFLALQRYDPSTVPGARYAYTFNFGYGFGRVIIATTNQVDLADLWDAPWFEHKVAGYSTFWISRVDGCAFTADEVAELEDDTIDDFRFDYGADELHISWDPAEDGLTIQVDVHDAADVEHAYLADDDDLADDDV